MTASDLAAYTGPCPVCGNQYQHRFKRQAIVRRPDGMKFTMTICRSCLLEAQRTGTFPTAILVQAS